MTAPDGWINGPHIFLNQSRQSLSATEHGLIIAPLQPGHAIANRIVALRDAMFAGQPINASERRAAGHWAARHAAIAPGLFTKIPGRFAPQEGLDRMPCMRDVHSQCRSFADGVASGQPFKTFSKPIRQVIHLGIGGSDLGPQLMGQALAEHAQAGRPAICFLSNLDYHATQRLILQLRADETLVVIASKSFTTQETLSNAGHLRQWMISQGVSDHANRFVAITSDVKEAARWGVGQDQIFHMDETIGGRTSLWSPVSLAVRIGLGNHCVDEMLLGGAEMDEHFLGQPLEKNLPARLAAADFYNLRARNLPTLMVSPYDSRLALFVPYLKQLWMESLGKQVDVQGRPIDGPACPILWGDTGTNAQHAFFQLLHQGVQGVAVELIGVLTPDHHAEDSHDGLLANLLAQAQALSIGQQSPSPERTCLGGHPVNLMMLDALTPRSLGALIALWEHRVLCLSAFTHVNPFDQWGVVLGKSIAAEIQGALCAADGLAGSGTGTGKQDRSEQASGGAMDPLTEDLVRWIKARQKSRV